MHHEFGEQRVVVRRGPRTRDAVRVDADARPGRQVEALERAAGWPRMALRIQRFGIDAPLDREPARPDRLVRIKAERGQRRAGSHGDLQLHQVQARHFFRDRVLDLQARVGLDEDERQLGRALVQQELEGAEAAVVHRPRHLQRGLHQFASPRIGQGRAGRDLHQLLEAPLQRAFALAQRDDLRAVAQHLDLDVARVGHEALQVHAVHAEAACFGRAPLVGLGQLGRIGHRAHAAPAAAAEGLDHHPGCAVRGEELLRLLQRDRASAAGQHRYAALRGQRTRARLVAEEGELFDRGADEGDTRLRTGLREVGALAQEPVARVHRVAAGLPRDRDHARDVQIGSRAGGAERQRLAGVAHVRRLRVVVRIQGHTGGAEVVHRTHQPQCDFAAVGDEDLLEHGLANIYPPCAATRAPWYIVALMSRHVRSQHRIRIAAPADAAFMFFTPAGESLWVPHWQPRYLHPADGATCAGMAFTTGEGDEFTLWSVAQFDRAARRACYARTTPASRMGLVRIACDPVDQHRCEVTVEYDMTALNEQGEAALAAYEGQAFRDMIDGWGESIGARLPQLLGAHIP